MKTRALALAVGLTLGSRASAQTAPITPPWARSVPPPAPVGYEPVPTAAQPAPPSRPPERTEPLFRGAVGVAYRRMFVASLLGFDLNVSIGGTVRWDAALFVGETFSGRGAFSARLGMSFLYPIGRLRLGGGLQAMYVNVERVTRDDNLSMMAMTFFALAQVDVVRWDGNSIFLGLRGGVDLHPIPYGTAAFEVGFGR